MFKRIIFVLPLMFSVRVATGASQPVNAQDHPTKSRIVAVDAGMLAKAVFPDCRPAPNPPILGNGGVLRTYKRTTTGETVRLVVGIYRNDSEASRAFERTSPQVPVLIDGYTDARCFFSTRGCHLRIRNVIVLLFMENCWVENCGPVRNDETAQLMMKSIAESLEQGLHDPAVVGIGAHVNTPKIQVLQVARLSANERVLQDACNVICDCEEDLLDNHGGLEQWRVGNGRFQIDVHKGWGDGEPVLRLARVTGEVCALRLGEPLKAATTVVPAIAERRDARRKATRRRVDAMDRQEVMERLRGRQGDLYEQEMMALRLSQTPVTEEVTALYLDIVASDRDPVIKENVLYRLACVRGKDALPYCRQFAADRTLPARMRRNAIRLVGELGDDEDIALLERIKHEGVGGFSKTMSSAIKRLEAKSSSPQKVP